MWSVVRSAVLSEVWSAAQNAVWSALQSSVQTAVKSAGRSAVRCAVRIAVRSAVKYYFQQDGATAHTNLMVREWLHSKFGDRVYPQSPGHSKAQICHHWTSGPFAWLN